MIASPRRRWLGRVGLACGSLLLGLVAAELLLRLLGIAPARFEAPLALESADKRVALDLYPDDPEERFPLDLRDDATRARWATQIPEVASLGSHPHAVPLRFDAMLCRGEGPGPAPRLVVVGDSFTEGQGVEEQDTFVARLDASLDVSVVGCGRRGLDFPRLSERFEELVDALEPDAVLYAMVLNDIARSDAFHARQRFIDDWIVDRRRQVESMHGVPNWPPRLVQVVDDRLEGRRVGAATTRWYREMIGPDNAAGWQETVARIVAMNTRLEGRFLVALWPLLVSLDDSPFRDLHRTIRETLEAAGVSVVDTLAAFEGQDAPSLWVHPADRHPNAAAHALFADAVEAPLIALMADIGSGWSAR
ncbi:MAG: SGNH/GDSL hydrolase family protein [Sandaracinaceae bacterium]